MSAVVTKPTILVATWTDGVFAITGDRCVCEHPGQAIRGLASDGRGGALAIAGGHSLLRRRANGGWVQLASSDRELSCCLAVRETIYVGTDDARLLTWDGESGVLLPLDGFDDVAGRESWFAGSAIVDGVRVGPPLSVRSLAASSDAHVLFASVHVGGIPRSVDRGRTWHPTLPVDWDVHEVRTHGTNPRIVAAAAAVGLCMSRDGGVTWTVEDRGLHARHCSALAFAGDDILVTASTDPFASEGRIYRRTNSLPDRMVAVQGGLPPWTAGIIDTACIVAKGRLVAAADRAGNVYISGDAGWSWSRASAGLPSPSGILLC